LRLYTALRPSLSVYIGIFLHTRYSACIIFIYARCGIISLVVLFLTKAHSFNALHLHVPSQHILGKVNLQTGWQIELPDCSQLPKDRRPTGPHYLVTHNPQIRQRSLPGQTAGAQGYQSTQLVQRSHWVAQAHPCLHNYTQGYAHRQIKGILC